MTAAILPGWSLACPRCGFTSEPAVHPRGCPACREAGITSGLAVVYDQPAWPAPGERTMAGIWKHEGVLPAIDPALRLTLGEGETPLVRVPALSEATGCERLFLKLESCNPTAAHKDRFHAVAVAVGRALGSRGVVSSSTGNHGFSMASYAAAHGMKAVVLAHARMPPLLQRAIRFAGGLPIEAPPGKGGDILAALVEEDGWYPSTVSWPLPIANPFGVEGYKTIGYELYRQLDGRMPDLVFVPAAAGDGIVGLARAIADLRRIGLPAVDARLCAAQPATAAPLVAALERGTETVPYLPGAFSRALSIGDPIGGDQALAQIRASNGFGVAVPDETILATGRRLARAGLLVEPSSAAAVAGAVQAIRDRPELRQATIVCLITSSGLKWLDDYEDGASLAGSLRVETVDEARAAAAAFAE